MSLTIDPLGIAAERVLDNARLTAVAASIAAYSGDPNGLKDLQIVQAHVYRRLNQTSTGGNAAGTAYNQFGLEQIST